MVSETLADPDSPTRAPQRRKSLMRIFVTGLVAAVVAIGMLPAEVGRAQDAAYRLVADWPTLGPGVFFGQQRGWPDQAARDAAAAARRAAGGGRGGARPTAPPIYGQGISGIAIDGNDHIYVFNRGEQTVMVFDREGDLVRAGAERDMHGAPVAGGWLHSGEVDWDGNVWGGRAHEPPHPQVRPDPGTRPDADRRDGRARQRRHASQQPVRHPVHPRGQHRRHRRLRQQPGGALRARRHLHQAGRQGAGRPGGQGRRTRRVGPAPPGRSRRRRQPLSDRPGEPAGPDVRQPAELRPRVRQRGLEPLGTLPSRGAETTASPTSPTTPASVSTR